MLLPSLTPVKSAKEAEGGWSLSRPRFQIPWIHQGSPNFLTSHRGLRLQTRLEKPMDFQEYVYYGYRRASATHFTL